MLKRKKYIIVLFTFLVVALIIILIPTAEKEYIYPLKYQDFVETYSKKYDVDKYFIYAVINTESGFDENATSSVGARGLMQIMPDTFEWINGKIEKDSSVTYDNMYIAEYNIKYGAYLLSYLYHRFGSERLAAAAYHAGITQVDNWLEDENVSNDGITIDTIPSDVTSHYVDKVMKAWESYKNIYNT